MEVIEPGHIYRVDYIDKNSTESHGVITFVNREPGTEHEGTQSQELLRVLIDRTMHCDNCLRWDWNDKIIYHLRMALIFHEMRALERKVEKYTINPEDVSIGEDGHFVLKSNARSSRDACMYDIKKSKLWRMSANEPA